MEKPHTLCITLHKTHETCALVYVSILVFSNTCMRPMMHISTFRIVIGWLKLVIGTNNVLLIGPKWHNLHDCIIPFWMNLNPSKLLNLRQALSSNHFFSHVLTKTFAHLPTSPTQATYLSHPSIYLYLPTPCPLLVKPLFLGKTFDFSWLNIYFSTKPLYLLG